MPDFAGGLEQIAASSNWFITKSARGGHGSGDVRVWRIDDERNVYELPRLGGDTNNSYRVTASRNSQLVAASVQSPNGRVVRVWSMTKGNLQTEIETSDWELALASTGLDTLFAAQKAAIAG